MHKRWVLPPPVPVQVEEALGAFSGIERRILFRRGLLSSDAARHMLDHATTRHDPLSLHGVGQAVERILHAKREGQRVAVYGDYDADGITASAVLIRSLRSLGLEVVGHLPDRFVEGYGLRSEALGRLASAGAKLVISVDCGIRSVDEAAWAAKHDLDLIITDHHDPGPTLPEALAVVNPKLADQAYPFRGLSGAGVAYKLVEALAEAGEPIVPESVADLAAVGTVADLAPLVDENRSLVWLGLGKLNRDPNLGLALLMQKAGVRPGGATASAIGFSLGPRLNAPGRVGSPQAALDLMLSDDPEAARLLAEALESANRTRQSQTRQAVERARLEFAGLTQLPSVLSFSDADLGQGILGLVAGRLTEEFYRPSIVARMGTATVRASLRSIPEFPITSALEELSEFLLEFGGHETAGGLTARAGAFEEFLAALEAKASEVVPAVEGPALAVDAIVSLPEMTEALIAFLDRLEPFGQENVAPLFVAPSLSVVSKRSVGSSGTHLRLTVSQEGRVMDGIAFGMGALAATLPPEVDVAFHLETNEYLGRTSLQLNVKDIRPARRDFSLRSDT
jgi:single-stranded-DNA-specific exonuclease